MEKKTFKESMARLEEIVSHLENEDIELENALEEFKEGIELITKCEKDLNNFDSQIKDLIAKNGDGNE